MAHGGGIFRSCVLEFDSPEDQALKALNTKVMNAFGMRFSASHTEYIQSNEDGQFYFLETSSRVGGAHLAEMVEASSGINLWGEWAKIETGMATKSGYQLPAVQDRYAGIVVSLSHQEWPDLSTFSDPEIVWRMHKQYHVGLIVSSDDRARVLSLLDQYAERIYKEFHASAPAPDKPTH